MPSFVSRFFISSLNFRFQSATILTKLFPKCLKNSSVKCILFCSLIILLSDLEKIILPFLYNLQKSDEPYIHWPNRGPIIKAQIEKILKLTRN